MFSVGDFVHGNPNAEMLFALIKVTSSIFSHKECEVDDKVARAMA